MEEGAEFGVVRGDRPGIKKVLPGVETRTMTCALVVTKIMPITHAQLWVSE